MKSLFVGNNFMGIMKNGIVYGETFDAREIPLLQDGGSITTLKQYFLDKRPGRYWYPWTNSIPAGYKYYQELPILNAENNEIIVFDLIKSPDPNYFQVEAFLRSGNRRILGIAQSGADYLKWKFPKEPYRFHKSDFIITPGETEETNSDGFNYSLDINTLIARKLPYFSHSLLTISSTLTAQQKLTKLNEIIRHYKYDWTLVVSDVNETDGGSFHFSGWCRSLSDPDSHGYPVALGSPYGGLPEVAFAPFIGVYKTAQNLYYLAPCNGDAPIISPQDKIKQWLGITDSTKIRVIKLILTMTPEPCNASLLPPPYPEIYSS